MRMGSVCFVKQRSSGSKLSHNISVALKFVFLNGKSVIWFRAGILLNSLHLRLANSKHEDLSKPQ